MTTFTVPRSFDEPSNGGATAVRSQPARRARTKRRRKNLSAIAPAALLDLASEPILVCNPTNMTVACANRAACRLVGSNQKRLFGLQLTHVIDRADVSERVRAFDAGEDARMDSPWHAGVNTVDAGRLPVEATCRRLVAKTGTRYVAIVLRPLGIRGSHNPSFREEPCDELTGLPTRSRLKQHLDALIDASASAANRFAVLFLDLDGFKLVNDSYGHQVGDRVLSTAAARFQKCTRPHDLVSRYGGDEFVIVLSDVDCDTDASRIVERIHASLQEPILGQDWAIHLSVSIGLSFSTAKRESAEELIEMADQAMYREKRNRRADAAEARHRLQ